MQRFTDKNVLITGGTSGIGLATAKRLIEEGARVAVTGTSEERLATARSELPGALVIKNDAADPRAAEALAGELRRHFGRLDALFLNAGNGRFQPFSEATIEEFDAEFHANVAGPLLEVKALAPLLADGGAIVLTSSIAHLVGVAGSSIYAATKGALRTLARVLARELADRNIRVNALSPGPIETGFFDRSATPKSEVEQFASAILAKVPLRRFGKAEEVASVAAFLLSSDASFVTGAEFVVDGGLSQL